MSEVISYGLSKIEFGEPTGTNTMPVAMAEKFRTYRDSCEFSEDEPNIKPEYADQSDDPIISIGTKGKKSVKVSTFDYSPEVLQFLKGGTILDGQWHEPVGLPVIEKAVRLTTNTGLPIEFPKAQIMAKFNAKLTKEGVQLLEVTITPLAADSSGGSVIIGVKE